MEKIKYFEEEIGYICDNSLKSDIVFLINKLPDYFFEIPASSTGKYHPAYAISKGGLLKHTKVATKIAKVLLDNETIGMNFSSREKDLIIMALIIHDGLKKGVCEEKYTAFEHPLLVSRLIPENKDYLRMDEDDIKIRRTLNQICEDNSSLVKGQMDCKEILRIAPLYGTVF